jgi:hypothetical protein
VFFRGDCLDQAGGDDLLEESLTKARDYSVLVKTGYYVTLPAVAAR